MSTTTERAVAMGYAAGSGQKMGIVLEMQQGMVDRGADIGFLSQCAKNAGHGCGCTVKAKEDASFFAFPGC